MHILALWFRNMVETKKERNIEIEFDNIKELLYNY